MTPDLTARLGPLTLKNPVVLASGAFGYGDEFLGLAPYEELGALALKTITREPRRGNPPGCRTAETPAGLINSIGLENVGLEAFLQKKLPTALAIGTSIIASIAGETPEDFAVCARALDATDVAAIEINISCPNVHSGGMAFGIDPVASREVVSAVREATRKPIIAKLTPNVTDVTVIAASCEAAGADILSLTNTFQAMVIDPELGCPILAANTGGLSGPAIRPIAVYQTYRVGRAVQLPLLGLGGIWNASDALQFVLAGASAIAIGTALYADPAAGNRVLRGIEAYLVRRNVPRLTDIVGTVRLRG